MPEITIVISPDADLEAAATHLEQAGVQIEHKLSELSMITGSADETLLEGIRALPEVTTVEEIPGVSVAPPDADIQ